MALAAAPPWLAGSVEEIARQALTAAAAIQQAMLFFASGRVVAGGEEPALAAAVALGAAHECLSNIIAQAAYLERAGGCRSFDERKEPAWGTAREEEGACFCDDPRSAEQAADKRRKLRARMPRASSEPALVGGAARLCDARA